MKRVLIISDTHGDNSNFQAVLDKTGQPDFFIHCGDLEGSEYYYENILDCEKIIVRGNNDYMSGLPGLDMTDVFGVTVGAVHGHRYHVNAGTEDILDLAEENGMDVICYGHSHKPTIDYDYERRIWMLNPGSLTYPRQEGHRPSYIVMEIKGNHEIDFAINYL